MTIPSTAVQRGPDGFYVYTIGDDRRVRMQPVTVAQMADGTSVVEQGLQAGTQIVVSGQYRLLPGSLVEPTARTAVTASRT